MGGESREESREESHKESREESCEESRDPKAMPSVRKSTVLDQSNDNSNKSNVWFCTTDGWVDTIVGGSYDSENHIKLSQVKQYPVCFVCH